MARPHGLTAGVGAAILIMPFVCGCARDLPTSTSTSVVPRAIEQGQPPATVDFVLLPDATSTLRHFPELGILDGGGVSGDVQSSYARTTETNREFRRGFAEFVVTELPDGFFSARIVLNETRAMIGLPVPPDRHELSFYADADAVVAPDDFNRSTSPIGTFETHANLEGQTFALDVTAVVDQQRGSTVGFRVKLEVDPVETGFRGLGSSFVPASEPPGVVIELTGARPADAIHYMQHVIGRLELSPRVEERLLDPLGRALGVLQDDVPGNDRAACGHLIAFLLAVDRAEEAPGELTTQEARYLRETSGNVTAALGCPGI